MPIPRSADFDRPLRDLLDEQATANEAQALMPAEEYLTMGKPIASPDRSSVPPPPKRAEVQLMPAEITEEDRALIAGMPPVSPNHHLHVRDTLLLALRVLQVNEQKGVKLAADELEIVKEISTFAM